MSWQIVRHAFIMVFGNLVDALKVSLGPFLIGIVLAVVTFQVFDVPFSSVQSIEADSELLVRALPVMLIIVALYLFVFSWVAVSWHRFILLEEYSGLLPSLAGRPIGAYVWRSILLGLVMVLLAIPLSIVAGLVIAPFMSLGVNGVLIGGVLVGIILGTILGWLWLRLAVVLPATAVGKSMKMGESWSATAKLSGKIFGVILILTLLNGAATAVISLIGVQLSLVAQALNIIVTWVQLMIGVSVLTTLYGHLVEGRDLV